METNHDIQNTDLFYQTGILMISVILIQNTEVVLNGCYLFLVKDIGFVFKTSSITAITITMISELWLELFEAAFPLHQGTVSLQQNDTNTPKSSLSDLPHGMFLSLNCGTELRPQTTGESFYC